MVRVVVLIVSSTLLLRFERTEFLAPMRLQCLVGIPLTIASLDRATVLPDLSLGRLRFAKLIGESFEN